MNEVCPKCGCEKRDNPNVLMASVFLCGTYLGESGVFSQGVPCKRIVELEAKVENAHKREQAVRDEAHSMQRDRDNALEDLQSEYARAEKAEAERDENRLECRGRMIENATLRDALCNLLEWAETAASMIESEWGTCIDIDQFAAANSIFLRGDRAIPPAIAEARQLLIEKGNA